MKKLKKILVIAITLALTFGINISSTYGSIGGYGPETVSDGGYEFATSTDSGSGSSGGYGSGTTSDSSSSGDTNFGTVPNTGLMDIDGASTAMYVFIALSTMLWGFVVLKWGKRNGEDEKVQDE